MDSSKSPLSKYVIGGKLRPVSKAYHSKFLYKAELHVPGAWSLRNVGKNGMYSDLSSYLSSKQNQLKIKLEQHPVEHSLYIERMNDELLNANAKTIWELRELQLENKGKIATRLERSVFNIYAETEQNMLDLLTKYKRIARCVRYIYCPSSDEIADQLRQDVIFQKNPKYKFKITVKESKYTPTIKRQISNYVANHPGEICIPYTLRSRLESPTATYMYGHYFVNDESLLTFLKMISPDFVKKIYRIEQA